MLEDDDLGVSYDNIDPTEGENPFLRTSLILFVFSAVLVIGTVYWHLRQGQPKQLVFSSGNPQGTYYKLAERVKLIIDRNVNLANVSLTESQGSQENALRLGNGDADLAFIQSDANDEEAIRTVAVMYDEVFQIVVRKELQDVKGLQDLKGYIFNLGQRESGAYRTTTQILEHYGYELGDFKVTNKNYEDTARAFEEGKCDAAVFVSGLKTPVVEELINKDLVRFLPFGDPQIIGNSMEGLSISIPGLSPAVIPAHTYGKLPENPVGTVSVKAILAARRDVPRDFIRQIVESLFENRIELIRAHPVAQNLNEVSINTGLRFPLHKGARDYYERSNPPFFVAYSETISMVVTIFIALISGVFGMREYFKRRSKNQVDLFLLKVEQIAEQVGEEADSHELKKLREKLIKVRLDAVKELVAEKLRANASFLIFQHALNAQILEIDLLIKRNQLSSGFKRANNDLPMI